MSKLEEILSKVKSTVKEEGVFQLLKKSVVYTSRLLSPNRPTYKKWQKNIESQYLNDISMDALLSGLDNKPKFSIVFPVYNKDSEIIDKALNSILKQKYTNYEICISDGSTGAYIKRTKKYLDDIASKYPDIIKLSYLEKRKGINIVENTNNAISLSSGEYIVFMDCDDELSPNCLLELASGINKNPGVKFLYSDFDHIDINGKRYAPSFWPDWSPHLLLSIMYTTHVTCYRKDVIDQLKGLREGTQGAQDWDLVLRFSQIAKRNDVCHIPKILYHWRAYSDSSAMVGNTTKSWAYDGQMKAIKDHVKSLGYDCKIDTTKYPGIFKTNILVKGSPEVSILIAFKDKVDYLKKCIDSIRTYSTYSNYKIVLIDNGSKEKETLKYLKSIEKDKDITILNYDKPFHFGKMYNWACSEVKSKYLLILNNDIEVISKGWIEKLLGYAQLNNVGYVGAKLLYPDRRVQHAGVLVGHRGVAGHLQVLAQDIDSGYLSSLITTKNYLALTGACLLISKEKFFEVDGFDESLDPAYQDVDLGIKLYERGYYNVYMPDAKLIHYESVSRLDKSMNMDLVSDDINANRLRAKWPKYMYDRRGNDPFYNENLSYQESDCRVNVEN